MAALLKSAESKDFVGSNPTLSAIRSQPVLLTAKSSTTPYHTEHVVDPPGVLASDIDLDSPDLEAKWVSDPSNAR